MTAPRIVSRDEWLAARKALLAKEKTLTRQHDEVAASRRALPWVKVEKDYVFDTPAGRRSLADLFAGRSQLFVYHFMLAPGADAGCPGCSFLCDHVDGARQHFEHNDLKFVAVSRAPVAEIEAYRKRMGWTFDWVSSGDGDFNYDYGVSFPPEAMAAGKVTYNYEEIENSGRHQGGDLPGFSLFCKDQADTIFHTYSAYARGGEPLIGAYTFLDFAPKGRNETTVMDWMRRHDEYEEKQQ
jgi:predicted dithiol-disulfide oxidoreductase (DUF899 family)